jgi:hydrogenase maturation protease
VTPQDESGILLIGIGNPLRGDDAVGVVIARRIQERHLPGVRVLEHDGEGASLMEAWKGAQTVVAIDAVSSKSKPGKIYRFEATKQPLPGRMFQDSTHAFGLHEAIELSRALHQLPVQLIIYGIEGRSFAIGGRLSKEVEKAASSLVDRILAAAAALEIGNSRPPRPRLAADFDGT